MIPGRRSLNLIDLKDNNALTNTELRKFALTVGAAIIILFGFVLPWLFGKIPCSSLQRLDAPGPDTK